MPPLPSSAFPELSQHRQALLKGVKNLDCTGIIPGLICVFGETAFPVITAGPQVVGAASVLQRSGGGDGGKVVAFAHESVWDSKPREKLSGVNGKNDFDVLFKNSVRWASRRSPDEMDKICMAVVGEPLEWLEKLIVDTGMSSQVEAVEWSPVATKNSGECDVVLWRGATGSGDIVDPAHAPGLADLLYDACESQEIGVVLGVCPWGFEMVTSQSVKNSCAQSHFIRRVGLAYSTDMYKGSDQIDVESVCQSDLLSSHGRYVLESVNEKDTDSLTDHEALTISISINALAGVSGLDLEQTLPQLVLFMSEAEKQFDFSTIATEREWKVDHGTKAACLVAWHTAQSSDPLGGESGRRTDCKRAPGAATIWNTMNESLTSDPLSWPLKPIEQTDIRKLHHILVKSFAGWQSTGLFALPGEPVAISFSGECNIRGTWQARIGCHTDTLWHKPEMLRWPDMRCTCNLVEALSIVVSPFGGPLYFEFVENSPQTSISDSVDADEVTFSVTGAIQAPLFHQQLSDDTSWEVAKTLPAPFAEVVGKHMILSLPSVAIRQLSYDQIRAAALFWDEVVIAQCELAAMSIPQRPERIVCDIQISAGYMHSGYPIMVHLDQINPKTCAKDSPPLLAVNDLAQIGSWGMYHELGHNRQLGAYTFDGTTEVTVNIFTLYSMHKINGIGTIKHPWLTPHKSQAKEYLQSPDFNQWKADPGLALVCYAQLADRYGWDIFKKVMGNYLNETNMYGLLAVGHGCGVDEYSTDNEKMAAWVKTWNNMTGCDNQEFFLKWGWPVNSNFESDANQQQTSKFSDAMWGLEDIR